MGETARYEGKWNGKSVVVIRTCLGWEGEDCEEQEQKKHGFVAEKHFFFSFFFLNFYRLGLFDFEVGSGLRTGRYL